MSKENQSRLISRRRFINLVLSGGAGMMSTLAFRDVMVKPQEESEWLISHLVPVLRQIQQKGLPKVNEGVITSEISDGSKTYKLTAQNNSIPTLEIANSNTRDLYFLYRHKIVKYSHSQEDPSSKKNSRPTTLTNGEIINLKEELRSSLDSYLENNLRNQIG